MPAALLLPALLRASGPLAFIVSAMTAGVLNQSIVLHISRAKARACQENLVPLGLNMIYLGTEYERAINGIHLPASKGCKSIKFLC